MNLQNSDKWVMPLPPVLEPGYIFYYNSTNYLNVMVQTAPDDGGDEPPGLDPAIIILVITIPSAVGAVVIGLGLYFQKHPDKLKSFTKKLR